MTTYPIQMECSTPFGINETITTRGIINFCVAHKVLNAFRHQRNDHKHDLGLPILL